MKRSSVNLLSSLAIVFMGFGFPAVLAYLAATQGFNIWYAGIFSFLSIIGAAGVVAIAYGMGFMLWDNDTDDTKAQLKDVTKILVSVLEKMDILAAGLREIDEILKVEE